MSTSTILSPAEAVEYIKSCTGDPGKFRVRPRGFVDWKFGEVCEYLGYDRAVEYVEHISKMWWDWEMRYTDCLLATSYQEFLKFESTILI